MSELKPDYATPPGETLLEWLDERNMTQSELARRINVSEKMLSQLITGVAPLSRQTAAKLEMVTAIPASTWNALESHYQDGRDRLSAQELLLAQAGWLQHIPVKELRKLQVLTASPRDLAATVRQALNFFGVADVAAWERLWLGDGGIAPAFRKSPAFAEAPGAVAAWLRLGEIESEKADIGRFDPVGLREQLPNLRALTRKPDPARFVPEIVQIFARHGVCVLFIPEVVGSRCSGAAYWYHERPVVQLSLRHRSDDHLWFTLFHELAHVLLHGKREAFVSNGSSPDSSIASKEEEANKFARNLLIPERYVDQLPSLRSVAQIQLFADMIGVSPGVVVGRLQHDGLIAFNIGNTLKRRYKFVDN